jgi:hypothetical protein
VVGASKSIHLPARKDEHDRVIGDGRRNGINIKIVLCAGAAKDSRRELSDSLSGVCHIIQCITDGTSL